jgi:uncharacterized protein YciI
MLFVMFCIDRPGMAEKRAQAMPAHVDYLATNPVKLHMSGPLTSDDGGQIVGSLYVFDAPDRAAVEAFRANDPLVAADIWESVEVRAFNKRVGWQD